MKNLFFVIIYYFLFLTLTSCKGISNKENNIDTNSYIENFELLQQNEINNSKLQIFSPLAIVNTNTQNINLKNSLIEFDGKAEKNIQIKSSIAKFYNSERLITAEGNVIISYKNNFTDNINTNKISWELDNNIIYMNNKLFINNLNTNIYSQKGKYDLNLNKLFLRKVLFRRYIESDKEMGTYQINVNADNTTWIKHPNTLEFSSDKGQVVTVIEFFK